MGFKRPRQKPDANPESWRRPVALIPLVAGRQHNAKLKSPPRMPMWPRENEPVCPWAERNVRSRLSPRAMACAGFREQSMDEIVKDFLIASNENLDRLDQELVKLESELSSKELLASIFRTIHTIKGSCGFFGICAPGKGGTCGREFALAAARRKTRAERGGYQRIAGHRRCGALSGWNRSVKDASWCKGKFLPPIGGCAFPLNRVGLRRTSARRGSHRHGAGRTQRLRNVACARCRVYVPDESSSVVWGMPGFVARSGLADKILPLDQIGAEIIRTATMQIAARTQS